MIFDRIVAMINDRNNRKSLYSSQEYWDGKASSYRDTAISMWPNKSLNNLYEVEQKRVVIKYLAQVEGYSMLDLGCGTGRFSRWFASKGASVVGIDFSNDSLSIAREIIPKNNNPVYHHGSVFELNECGSYDIVFTWGVLTIACKDRAELLDALSRIRRSLRPGGRLLLTEPIHSGFIHRVLDMGLPEFLDVMNEAGFLVKATSPLHFWPMRILLCYIPWPAWITFTLYQLGQVIMKLPGFAKFGDYTAIYAYPVECN